MQINVVAPCPKKPSSTGRYYYNNDSLDMQHVQDACLELQQILTQQQQQNIIIVTRTGNPLVQDSSFIPLDSLDEISFTRCPRSYSVGDPRNHYLIQSPVY